MKQNDDTDTLETTRAELAETKDKYLRLVAEMDNFRKQQERRANERVRHEKKKLLLRVVEVVDDLNRALQYQEVADRDTLLGALRLTFTQLNAALTQEGVTILDVEGEVFDPRLHDAVDSVRGTGLPEGHVVAEIQRGYRYGDDLLRPARVHVSTDENSSAS